MKNNMNAFKNLIMILISVKVVTLFTNLAFAITNVAKAMMTFGFATLFTKGGLLGIAKAIAKGGAIFLAFKGMEKLFDDMAKGFEDFKHEVKNSLPDARDLHKVMVQTKKSVVDVAKVEEAIAKAKEKQAQLQSFIFSEQNKKRLKFHELEAEGVEKFKKQNDVAGQVLEKLKQQNSEFSMSSEILSTINSFTSRVSRSIAEAVVLGKSLNMSFKELAQNLLVDVLAKMIERIMLLTIEKFLTEKIFKQDKDKLNTEKAITKENKNKSYYKLCLWLWVVVQVVVD